MICKQYYASKPVTNQEIVQHLTGAKYEETHLDLLDIHSGSQLWIFAELGRWSNLLYIAKNACIAK